MNSIFTDYLFDHGILVSEYKEAFDVAFSARYLLESTYGIRITEGKSLVTKDMVPYVALQLGENVPEPFYRGFPDSVRELTTEQLMFDQAIHYLRTYGLGDFTEAGHSVMEDFIESEREFFQEKVETKDFVVLSEAEAVNKLAEYVEDLLAGTRPLNDDRYAFVRAYIAEYQYEIQNCASKNLAIRLLLDERDVRYASFLALSDVIKLVDELSYQFYNNTNIKKLNLKNKDRKFITEVINYLFALGKCDIRNCYEKKALWSGLLHHIHYQSVNPTAAQFVEAMRGKSNFSVYAAVEQAIREGNIKAAVDALKAGKGSGALLRNLNYLISRCESEEEMQYVMSQISSTNGIVLLQLLLEYSKEEMAGGRNFKFTKHNKLKVHEETIEEQQKRKSMISQHASKLLCEMIQKNLENTYKGKVGKVYIDDAMEGIALPLQENTSSSGYGALPKGSRIAIPEGKKIRAFTYWEKVHDIDLSTFGLTKDGQITEFSWRTMAGRQSGAITYSGDVTSGYYGGSEFFDIDIEQFRTQYPSVTHLIFCNNVYSLKCFKDCICRAGYMLRDVLDSGRIYEPKTVKSSFTIDAESTFAYLFAIDLEKREMIWLNIARESRARVAGSTKMSFLTEYFDVTSVINVKRFFEMLATEVVENQEDADIIVSDKESDVIEGKELIRSCDFERMIALMNC